MDAVTIDPEFMARLFPLADDELCQLEKNLVADGCRDPLVTWEGILLDGHNRHDICTRLKIPFKTVAVDLPDREAALDWIDKNQYGRRNLTPDQRTIALGRIYNREKKKHGGERTPSAQNEHLPKTSEAIAEKYGVHPSTVRRAGKTAEFVEKLPSHQSAAILSGKKRIVETKREKKEESREKRREKNRELIGETPVLPAAAKFATIVIDPPWDWGDEGDVDQLGRARPTYGTMTFDELKAIPVATLADDDCHIYLWITNRSLPKGFALLDAWGFRYITCLTWCKPSIGMGNYFRGSSEQILFGIKGSQPLKRKDVGTWFAAPRGARHSSKPDESFDLIESCSPGPYLEMFSRSLRNGWTAWGAEAK